MKERIKHKFDEIIYEDKIKKFNDELSDECNNFIKANAPSILSSSIFYNYVNNYHLFEHIAEHYLSPQKSFNEFLEEKKFDIFAYINEKTSHTSVDDENKIKDFIIFVYNKYESFFKNKFDIGISTILYREDNILNNVQDIKHNMQNFEHILLQRFDKIDVLSASLEITTVRKEYKFSENYIPRAVISAHDSQTLYFRSNTSIYDLLQVCKDKKRIVLIGEAGCGKTYALKNLAAQVYEEETEYYPLFIYLMITSY